MSEDRSHQNRKKKKIELNQTLIVDNGTLKIRPIFRGNQKDKLSELSAESAEEAVSSKSEMTAFGQTRHSVDFGLKENKHKVLEPLSVKPFSNLLFSFK